MHSKLIRLPLVHMLKTTLLKTMFVFFSNHEKFWDCYFNRNQPQGHFKKNLLFPLATRENNIYLRKIFPWRLRKKKKKIRTRNETQVTFAIFYHCGRTLKTTNDMYHFSGVK